MSEAGINLAAITDNIENSSFGKIKDLTLRLEYIETLIGKRIFYF